MKQRIDPSSRLAWAIAHREAFAAGSQEIEPIHLFLALLHAVDDAWHEEAERLRLGPEDTGRVERLAEEARALLGMDRDGVTRLRRRIRRDLHATTAAQAPSAHLHRSARLRGLYALADELAARDGSEPADLRHLVQAALIFPSPDLAEVVPGRGPDKPELTWETHIHRFADDLDPGHVTILVSDIEGSTSLKTRFGDRQCAKIFRAHDELFRDHLARSPGAQIIKGLGDGFLLAFPSGDAAVRFALQVQAALRTRPALAKIPVHVRMGIHAGEILRRHPSGSTLSEPYFGIAIDMASRVSSLARGNQILVDGGVAATSRAALESAPPPGVGTIEWRHWGSYWVKGCDEPVEIHEVGEAGKAAFIRPEASTKAGPLGATALAPTTAAPPPDATAPARLGGGAHGRPPTPSLDLLGSDLTQAAREGRLAPVLARHDEILALARHLSRTSKRNVLVVGDAGVGKTAVVEGFARWVVEAAPEPLRRLRVVQFGVGDLMAGTRHRGDLEERIQGILKDAVADPDLVLFLDEIHLALRGSESSVVADLLKPALAREDFRCIGATTTEEYDRVLKSDAAFVRRFQVVRVEEPDRDAAIEICRGWARRIEERQFVLISEDAVTAAVDLSREHLRSRALPDKAIDLLENVATRATVSTLSLQAASPAKKRPVLGAREVEEALEEQYGIRVRRDAREDPARAQALLDRGLVGQCAAIEVLARGLEACDAHPREERPRAVFLLTGPTGVGKTRSAELLADALFGEGALLRINMSELKERHELARLTGAPPGFIGHDAGSPLFLHVERHPQGLVLLDEAEKAHPEVMDFFLQVFDKGAAMDPHGRRVDFRQQVFVLTCNLASGTDADRIGFALGSAGRPHADPERDAVELLRRHFRPEFLGRIDRVVRFIPLGREDYRELLARAEAAPDAIRMPSASAVEAFLDRCVALGEGVRGFRRLLEEGMGPGARTE